MRIGINATGAVRTLDDLVAAAVEAEQAGFDSFWIAQIFGLDALTALSVVGVSTDRIELGTAVIPTYPRHPMMLAQQALTTQLATGDRLALGIGLSHQIVVESMWGFSYAKPLRHMREYLEALLPLLRGESVAVQGEDITCMGSIDVPGAAAPPVIIAALGPKMLELAGSTGCGTITWCTGERTLLEHVTPSIVRAAEAAGQPAPRVVAGLPICVTDDVDGTRALIAEQLSLYGELPSYRAMLDREGVDGPAEVAIVGDEAHVAAALARLDDGGVTEFSAVISATNPTDRQRTWDLLAASR